MKAARFLFVLLAALMLLACEGGIFVNGKVVGPDNRPISGAHLRLDRPEEPSARTFESASDKNGCFDIGGLDAPGVHTFTLHVTQPNFKDATVQVNTEGAGDVVITLEPENSRLSSKAAFVKTAPCGR